MEARYFPPFTTPVRGHRFAGAPPGGHGLEHVREVALVREPQNPRDSRAVAVWARTPSGGWRIGYLERAVARRLAPRLDAGQALRASAAGWLPEPGGRWLRPAVRVAAPGHLRPSASAAEDRLDGQQRPGRQEALDEGVVDAA